MPPLASLEAPARRRLRKAGLRRSIRAAAIMVARLVPHKPGHPHECGSGRAPGSVPSLLPPRISLQLAHECGILRNRVRTVPLSFVSSLWPETMAVLKVMPAVEVRAERADVAAWALSEGPDETDVAARASPHRRGSPFRPCQPAEFGRCLRLRPPHRAALRSVRARHHRRRFQSGMNSCACGTHPELGHHQRFSSSC